MNLQHVHYDNGNADKEKGCRLTWKCWHDFSLQASSFLWAASESVMSYSLYLEDRSITHGRMIHPRGRLEKSIHR